MGHIAPVNSVDFASGNSDYLVTSGRDRAVKIWHWRSKTVKLNIDLRKYGRGTGLLLFEPELALLVGLQVMSSKEEGGGREEGELSDKFFGCLSQKLK